MELDYTGCTVCFQFTKQIRIISHLFSNQTTLVALYVSDSLNSYKIIRAKLFCPLAKLQIMQIPIGMIGLQNHWMTRSKKDTKVQLKCHKSGLYDLYAIFQAF